MGKLRTRVMAGAVALGLLLVSPAAYAGSGGRQHGDRGHGRGEPLTVMTRNLYLGADINRPVEAAQAAQAAGGTPQDVVVALANATHDTRAIVDQTSFPVRSRLLAREIARTRPDLVGLQEVALWRSGPLELGAVGVPNATTVDYDFLALLLAALDARGAHYEAVVVGDRADVEAPSFTGSPFDGSIGADAQDIRLTMRDVILKRAAAHLQVTATGDQVYAHNLAVSISGVTMNFDRGFEWADVRSGSRTFRFVNTHLEAFSSDLAYAQAGEMLAALPTDEDVVVVCDCNSDPLNSSVKPFDHVPHKAPYELIVGSGFTDEWLQWKPAEQGWTSGLSETVDDPTAAGFDHRIDMVFGRTAEGTGYDVKAGAVTGTRLCDRDRATGLWPSDHGGVVLRLTKPRPVDLP
ncbi:MAG: endonuclease/exonuclease/phosphatase family protein [Nocardioidaceae bacterium]